MIDLGISRVSRLLGLLGNPHINACWKAIHVAGTNGKGSVCAYLSSILCEAKISNGRFTSPHLIHKWDCIYINGRPVSKDVFYEVETLVQKINTGNQVGATEFEVLTATAFEIFKRMKVKLAVVEVGLGGRLDATNVLPKESVFVSVITKIGVDHENFLGSTLKEIAAQKAGILKPNIPCVVDGSNDPEVLEVVKETAAVVSADVNTDAGATKRLLTITDPDSVEFDTPLLGAYQKANLSCALKAIEILTKSVGGPRIGDKVVAKGIANTSWPGRLQYVDLYGKRVLIDGAHNKQSAVELKKYVDKEVRGTAGGAEAGVTWIIGFSKPEASIRLIIDTLGVTASDTVYATTFGDIDGMPWVKPSPEALIRHVASDYTDDVSGLSDASLETVIRESEKPVVICGSLYLVSEILRL